MHQVLTWPVGRDPDGDDVRRPPAAPIVAYAAAALLGGAVTGAAVSAAGALFHAGGGVVVSATAMLLSVAAIALEMAHRVAPLPERRRQVPRTRPTWRAPDYGRGVRSDDRRGRPDVPRARDGVQPCRRWAPRRRRARWGGAGGDLRSGPRAARVCHVAPGPDGGARRPPWEWLMRHPRAASRLLAASALATTVVVGAG